MSLLNVILEGKKENLIDKYKDSIKIDGFENLLGEFIDKDPSATKKYSEWMVKELIRIWKSPGYSQNSLVDLMNFMGDEIKRFHELSNSITDKDVEYFLKQIDNAKSRGTNYFDSPSKQDLVKRSPKDIYSYPTLWVVQIMNNSVKERKRLQQEEEEAKKDVEKIYEDGRFLIVQPFSHKASCYYGANTKWCVSMKNDSYYFNRYTTDSRLYYIIDKESAGNNSLGKMALVINNNGNVTVWDQQDNQRTVDFMLERFEPISDLLKKMIKGDDDYEKLKNAKSGSRASLNEVLSADYFDKMDQDYVYLEFDNLEDYLSLFVDDIDEYYLKDIEYAIETPYGYDNMYYDSYNFDEDMREGYPLYVLTQNHLKKLREIIKLSGSDLIKCFSATIPKLNKDDLRKFIEKGNDEKDFYDLYNLRINNGCESEIGKFLLNFDTRFTDDFAYAYSTAEDESMKVGVREALSDEVCDIYSPIGMEKNGDCFSSYMIPIDNLIKFYEEDLESYSGLTLDQLLKTVVPNKVPFDIREPREWAYEVRDDKTFEHHFNSDMDFALDTLLEKLENSEDYSDLDEYKRIYTFISNKYGFDKSIPVETTEGDVTIKLINIDPTDNKISFELMRSGENFNFKKGKAKLSTIQQLMSNYQLFDPFED